MAGYRNCSMILQYTAQGVDFFDENPAGMAVLNTLADFDSIKSKGRRKDYLAELPETRQTQFTALLANEIKLLSAPHDVLRKLAEYDGKFMPEHPETLEVQESN